MEKLNAKLNEEFFREAKGDGEPITFSPEEHEKCRESYIKFSEEESEIEKEIRKERVLAAKKPSVPLTF